MNRAAAQTPRSVDVAEIVQWIRYHCDKCQTTRKAGVTFLVGAGFSASAGIPTAGQMVSNTLRPHPLLSHVKAAPPDQSEYAHLMSNLPPVERTRIIREAIENAQDPDLGRTKINWAHLLLATLVDSGYINQILTTNFDPLIVEALSLTGQPIHTFDLNASKAFQAGALPIGSVIYLHGQAHGLWLCNSDEELARVRQHLNSVFQDALRDCIFIVVGYSGVCDPVLVELADRFPQFRHRLLWVHHNAASDPGEHAMKLLTDHYREAYLVKGMDADAFMRELVLEGLHLDLPLIVRDPLKSLQTTLARFSSFPARQGDPTPDDPVQGARRLILEAEDCISRVGREGGTSDEEGPQAPPALMSIAIKMAATARSRPKLDELRRLLARSKKSELHRELGKAYLILASVALRDGQLGRALEDLALAESMDVAEQHWLFVTWGNALSNQAETKSGSEADTLFAQASEKYAEAVRIKPEMHEAWYSWGNALSNQAKTKSGPEADTLFAQASEKYAEAVRIKPEKHEAWYNWGTALSDQAKTKSGSEADTLFAQASEKYAEAVRIKPEKHEAWSNWGNALLDQAKTKSGSEVDTLFAQASEKYAEAVRIKPEKHEAWSNWGNALSNQAKTKSGPEATPYSLRPARSTRKPCASSQKCMRLGPIGGPRSQIKPRPRAGPKPTPYSLRLARSTRKPCASSEKSMRLGTIGGPRSQTKPRPRAGPKPTPYSLRLARSTPKPCASSQKCMRLGTIGGPRS